MAVRWLGIELPIVRIFPNLIVMVVMVATSSGLAKAGTPGKLTSLQSQVLVIVAAVLLIVPLIFSVPLGLSDYVLKLDSGTTQSILASLGILSSIVVALYVVFLRIGYALGSVFESLPPLKAYAFNLLGSLLGVVAFAVISWLSLPPMLWILILGASTFFLYRKPSVLVVTVALAGLAFVGTTGTFWSPYSKLEVKPIVVQEGSVLGPNNYVLSSNNCYFHFALRMLNKEEEEKFTQEAKKSEQSKTVWFYHRWLRLPFECAPNHDKVLVLGGGSGNDVAFALQAGAKEVDAVEIDPIICKLGATRHPNKPYADSRVHLHNEDARTFMRYSNDKFDLVEFAFLDPGTTLNSASFLRVDNYVYTVEAMKGALRLLKPDGVVCLTFATGAKSGVTQRLYRTIEEAQGKPPLAFTGESWDSVIFLFGPGAKNFNGELLHSADLKPWPGPGELQPGRASTDQWPFLYLDFDMGGIWLYIMVLVAAVVLPAAVLVRGTGAGISGGEWANMFFLGQAFMLTETKSITHLSLLLGATWIVSSAVIFTILVLAYLANLVVSKGKSPSVGLLYFLLSTVLIIQYFLPIPESTSYPPVILAIVYSVIDCLPVFFGSMIFSKCFANTKFANQALGANLLGVSLGGLTENFCVAIGINGLVFVALALYLLSFFAHTRKPKEGGDAESVGTAAA